MSSRHSAIRPVPGAPRPYRFPRFDAVPLANGVLVLAARVDRLPVVSIRLVIDAGARAENVQEAGVANLVALALAEGTARLDAAALADAFERLGGSLTSFATWDASQVTTTVLANRFEAAAALVGEVARSPAFPEREIERLRNERLAELLELRTEPRGLADERYAEFLFQPSSRLSAPEGGSERTVAGLGDAHCRAWHERHFVPTGATFVVAGDIGVDRAVAVAEAVLGDWRGVAPSSPSVDDAPARDTRAVRLVHRQHAPQTELRIGHVGLRRNHPDYFDVVVMNAILGGVFNSRINLNLRERNAYTYGAFSSFEWRRDAGPFTVATAVATPVTAPAVREVLVELGRMRDGPPTIDELSLSTSYLEGVFPIRFETTDAIAAALSNLRILQLPGDYYDTYRDRIRSVSAVGVERAARNHLHVSALQVLAVGDRHDIEGPLGDLGLGPLTVESS